MCDISPNQPGPATIGIIQHHQRSGYLFRNPETPCPLSAWAKRNFLVECARIQERFTSITGHFPPYFPIVSILKMNERGALCE
jgi:hypothetical protein